ncbi:MAG: glycosyltransferase family 39 protein [Planctomycetes bacterium]|nr:glycosyltransferase family 39 protein [Planctomycetota bacterium]
MTSTTPDPIERRLFWLCVVLGAWLCVAMPVFSQEAYYWCYAQHPDLSYYDHPPMVAWWIWLGTALLGDNVAGIRLGTWLFTSGTTWIGLIWLRRVGAEAWVRRGWLVCTFAMPLMMCTHFLTTPDPPVVFFWAAAMYALWRSRDGGIGWWVLAGAAAGGGLLSKYAAAFLAVGGVLILAFDPAMRRQLRRPGPYVGVLVAGAAFTPVVLWNVANDFESFRFQTEDRWANSALDLRWFGEFVGSQLGLLHPVIALALPFALIWQLRRALAGDRLALWLIAFGLPMPLFFLVNSLFIHAKINWLLPCNLSLAATVLLWWRDSGRAAQRPRADRILTRIMVGSAILLPLLAPVVRLLPQSAGTSWQGWGHIAERAEFWEEEIDSQDGIAGNVFFFASGYRDAAQLSLHLRQLAHALPESHELEGVLAQNVFGQPALEFDHWAPAEGHIGQDGIYVLLRPDRRPRELDRLARHFDSVERVERVEIESLAWCTAVADIYVARRYRGPGAR